MNGPDRKIEILAPFNQAIELTRLILFRPFDITKWLVIGFAAFLSGWLNSGGGSINPWSFRRWNTSSLQAPTLHETLQDQHCRKPVHNRTPLLDRKFSLAQQSIGLCRGQALIPKMYRELKTLAQFLREDLHLFRLRAFQSAHAQRQPRQY